MRYPRLLTAPLLAVALVLFGVAPWSAPTDRAAVAATPAITVTVGCYGNPETTRVRNNKGYAITIKTVGSIYQPRSNEPFSKTYKLGAGKVVTFKSGSSATAGAFLTLTRQYIYNNDVGTREGARVVTSAGTFGDRCG